jgi:hypothetical protein
MIEPSFFVVGVQRGGTTSLFSYLVAHPNVVSPKSKEIFFFNDNYEKGPEWYREYFRDPEQYRRENRLRETDPLISGEATSLYLSDPPVPRRIMQYAPTAKIIALLRNPVDRLHSAHQLSAYSRLTSRTFEESCDLELSSVARCRQDMESCVENSPRLPLTIGLYYYHLKRWFSCFSREKILVVNSEAFFSRTADTYAEILDFLNLPPFELPVYETHKVGPDRYRDMTPEYRARLQAFYEEHNEKLFSLLGYRFDWK